MSADHGRADRLPPYNREAEQSVLGSMLRENSVINDVLRTLRDPSYFYTDAHQKIFLSIVTLYDKGHPVDLVTLANWLHEQKYLEDVGGPAYLAELWDAAPTAANAEYYARIVRDKGVIRALIHANTEILRDAYDQAMPADELLEAAERRVLEIAEMGATGDTITLYTALQEAFQRIDARSDKSNLALSGVPSGFLDLDEKTAGFQTSELIIIAARPSVGKTAMALGIIRNIVTGEDGKYEGLPVFFVSLEQSRTELAERLLCCQARVDSHKLRKGHLSHDDFNKITEAGELLSKAKLFIDDTPGQSMLRIAANARRLKAKHDIKIVVIDYLQLIDPDNKRDSRQEQVAAISRRLKFLARELHIPVIALAQLNRGTEDRQDHRPRLSDLRESGCLTGDTLITLAESGARIPIRELKGKKGFKVLALDEQSMKLNPAEVSHAFSTGRKPVYLLRTKLGRKIRATGNHKFRTVTGWVRLDELDLKERIALPRSMPVTSHQTMSENEAALLGHLIGDGCTLPRHSIQYTTREVELAELVSSLASFIFGDRINPKIRKELGWYQVYLASKIRLTHGRRNAIAEWLDGLGVFGLRSWEKRVPSKLFCQPKTIISTFVRHLWATDGCIKIAKKLREYPAIFYATSSEELSADVQSLLLRLGINATARPVSQGEKGRTQYPVYITGHEDILSFCELIGSVGERRLAAVNQCKEFINSKKPNTNRDVIPHTIWFHFAKPAMQKNKITMRQMQQSLGMAFMGTGLYRQNVSRERIGRVAKAVGGNFYLEALSTSDVYWDEIQSISLAGEEEVFDLTVPGSANFIANDLIVHNSIEQDADTVMLLHRPDYYEPGQQEGVIEVIIGKQRNGPTGEVTLSYIKQFMRFENFAVEPPFSYGD